MTASTASEGVKLVERLRLGEAPEPVDWTLAAAILSLRDSATRFSDAARDLVEDREKSSSRARFVVRANLVAQLSRDLADSTAALQRRLKAYFSRRTTEEDPEPAGTGEGSVGASSEAHQPTTETGAALESGGVASETAGALGNAIEEARIECGWLGGALEALLSSKPDEDETLDFLSELEARFREELFSVELRGKKQYVAGALEEAVGRA